MIDGITYREAGEGNDTLLCLHGIGGDARSFHHQLGAFPKLKTVAWDMPGYHGSEARMMPPDFAHLSDRLAAFIDGLGSPVHLLGHSIGGMLALEHASHHAEQIKSLTLLATTPRFGGRDNSFKDAFLKARLGPLDAGQTMAQMATETAPQLVGPNTSPKEIALIEAGLADVPMETWRGILQCLVTFDRVADLDTITLPTLAVAGSVDRNAPAPTMEKMAARIKGARYHLMENAGHMPHQEMPAAFNAVLAQFLEEVITP